MTTFDDRHLRRSRILTGQPSTHGSAAAFAPGGPIGQRLESATATMLVALMDEILDPWLRGPSDDQLSAVPPLSPSVGQLMTRYGRRKGPVSSNREFHSGLDFWAPRGASVFAVQSGVVEWVLYDDQPTDGFVGYGNAVVLRHPDSGCWTFSAHLDELLVVEGMTVERGQLIGRVGNTTNDLLTDLIVRLHFEVRLPRGDGQSPFPGLPCVYNCDPETWLARHGIAFDRNGRFVVQRAAGEDEGVSGESWLEEDAEYLESPDAGEFVRIEGGFEIPTPCPKRFRPE